MAFTEVPCVDWNHLQVDRPRFLRDLEHALCVAGFAVLLHVPGFEADFQRSCFKEAHRFFALPDDVKNRYSINLSPQLRGWSKFFPETSGRVSIATEAFQLGPEKVSPPPSAPIHHRMLRGANLWPTEEVPELERNISTLHTRYIGLARDLGALICEMLAVDHQIYESFFELCDPPDYIAAMNLNPPPSSYSVPYRAQVEAALAEPRGAGAHVDGAPFVSLLIADQPGLEVVSGTAGWVPVPLIEGSVCVNIGASLMKMSGGRCAATVHRVNPLKPDPTLPRVSLPFFMMPKLEGPLVPFNGVPTAPPGYPVRNRAFEYVNDRWNLFPAAARAHYAAEAEHVRAALVKAEGEREEARRRRASKL